jgi:hypothetical protein
VFITTSQDSKADKVMDGELAEIIMLYSVSITADHLSVE